MNVSIFLARVFCLYFLAMGLTLIIRRKKMQEVLTSALGHSSCLFVISLMTLIIGILLVVAHPVFTATWTCVITVLAWLSLLKGLVYVVFPEYIVLTKTKILSYVSMYYISGVVLLALAAFLGYHGFGF